MNPSQIYRRLAELPVLTSVSFISRSHVMVESSVRDHVNNTKRTFVQDIACIDQPSKSSFWLSNPSERAESIVARLVSSSGQRTAILKETGGVPKKRFVEIWKGDTAELVVETTSKHGSFYGDTTFSSLCFSPNEDALLYTAESNPLEEDPKDPFHKFQFDQQFGETFIERRRPTLFWLRWKAAPSSSPTTTAISQLLKITPSIDKLDDKESHGVDNPPAFSLGQATFASRSGRSVLATAYFRAAGDRKLGIVYCTNRPSSIVRFTLPDPTIPDPSTNGAKKDEKPKVEEQAVQCHHIYAAKPSRSPRVWFPTEEEDAKRPVAVWLSSEKEPHGSCSSLHMMELPTKSELQAKSGWEAETEDGKGGEYRIETVVGRVWEPSKPVEEGGFPGLYIIQLPANPFLHLNGTLHVLGASSWGSHQVLVAVPLSTGGDNEQKVLRIPGPDGKDSAGLVTCNGDSTIVASFSSMTTPNDLYYTTVDHSSLRQPNWQKVTRISDRVTELLSNLHSEVFDVTGHEPVQTIYLGTKDKKPKPLITMPHGGPHAATPSTFSVDCVALALCGYSISLPNYTGSLGYGQRYVEALLGKIGRLDVDEVMASAKEMVKRGLAEEGPGMQLYMGGSHGGFLGAHVIGQFPDFFSACVLRNPVTNVGAMLATTDIPDWCTVEAGSDYNSAEIPSDELYAKLYAVSPIRHVDAVKTPLLLRIGDVDQRVPPSQGREYYHLLKARGMGDKVQMLWFPENGHPLDKVDAEKIGWDAQLAWFRKYGAVKDD